MTTDNQIFHIQTLVNLINENYPASVRAKTKVDVDAKISEIFDTLMKNSRLANNSKIKNIIKQLPNDFENETLVMIQSLCESGQDLEPSFGYELDNELKTKFALLINLIPNEDDKEISKENIFEILTAFKNCDITLMMSSISESFNKDITVIYSFISNILRISPGMDISLFENFFVEMNINLRSLGNFNYPFFMHIFDAIAHASSKDEPIMKTWDVVCREPHKLILYGFRIIEIKQEKDSKDFDVLSLPISILDLTKSSTGELIFKYWFRKFLSSREENSSKLISEMISNIIYLSRENNINYFQGELRKTLDLYDAKDSVRIFEMVGNILKTYDKNYAKEFFENLFKSTSLNYDEILRLIENFAYRPRYIL